MAIISFLCNFLSKEKAKYVAIGGMKNLHKQPVLQKINIYSISIKEKSAYLAYQNQISDEDIIILLYLSLFRIDKVEHTEYFFIY